MQLDTKLKSSLNDKTGVMLIRAKILRGLACEHLGFLCIHSCVKLGHDVLRDNDSGRGSKVVRVT